jgi:hypothetical protein
VPLDAALEVGHSQTSSPAGALTQRSQSLPKLPISHPRCIIREHWDLVEDATQPTDLLDSRTKIKQGTGQLLVPPRIHRPRLIRLPRGAKLPDYGGLPGRSRAIADRAAGQSLLAAHRNYLTYHSDACELAKGMPPGSQLEWYAVISAARACARLAHSST